MPKIRTVFGTAHVRDAPERLIDIEAAIETPTYDLTVFKLHFGRLTGKAYTKGERVLRFEAIAHNTAELRCGRMIEKFPEIVTRLARMVDGTPRPGLCGHRVPRRAHPDELPTGVPLGATRVGGLDLNNPACVTRCAPPWRWRRPPPVQRRRGRRQGARPHRCRSLRLHRPPGPLDLAARSKHLVDEPRRTPRYQGQGTPRRTIAALLTLRDQFIGPDPRRGAQPGMGRRTAHWTPSTVATNESASICRPSSTTSPSKRR